MEVVRQVLSVLLVFTLLGVVLWALRRVNVPNLGEFLSKGRRLSVPPDGLTPQRGIYPSRVLARFMSRPVSRAKSLHAVERLTLTPHHSLHLVELRGREFLVATHPQGCTLLTESVPAQSTPQEISASKVGPERLKA